MKLRSLPHMARYQLIISLICQIGSLPAIKWLFQSEISGICAEHRPVPHRIVVTVKLYAANN